MHSPTQTRISGLGIRLVHVCHMTIYNLFCTQGLLVVNSNDSNIFDTVNTLNMRHSILFSNDAQIENWLQKFSVI